MSSSSSISNAPSPPPSIAAEAALDFVRDGMRIGLGTGRAAAAFVEALGRRVAAGLRVTGVPTSEATAALARRLAIPLARLDEVPRLDITFDGADEVDPQLDLIKGNGAAMVREKIVALSSDQLVILVGPEKLVEKLGERGRLPIEVLPFGVALVRHVRGWRIILKLQHHGGFEGAYLPWRDCIVGFPYDGCPHMIAQMLTHIRQIGHNRNSKFA